MSLATMQIIGIILLNKLNSKYTLCINVSMKQKNVHQPTLMHNFLYSLTICFLNCYPRHVSSINMPIFRSKNYIHTTSDIFALCKLLHSTPVESGPVRWTSPLSTSVLCRRLQRAKISENRHC